MRQAQRRADFEAQLSARNGAASAYDESRARERRRWVEEEEERRLQAEERLRRTAQEEAEAERRRLESQSAEHMERLEAQLEAARRQLEESKAEAATMVHGVAQMLLGTEVRVFVCEGVFV